MANQYSDTYVLTVAIACLLVGFIFGTWVTISQYNRRTDTEVERVIARRTAQFDVTAVTVRNQEEVWIDVNAEEGPMSFVIYLGHPYFDKFLLLKPGDAISSQWAWCLPNAQKTYDRVYKYHQLYPWAQPGQPVEKTEGR